MLPLHVLVLSRGAERRDALVSALRGAGHQVVSVADAPAAAEAIGSTGFDAVVLDLGWPELEPARLREAVAPATPSEPPESLDAAERRHIALTLRYTGGNRRRAAQLLGISRSTLLHKVRKYDLDDS